MNLKTEKHRKLAERMSSARVSASYPAMSRVEFLAQTPKELRVTKVHDPKPQKRSGVL